MKILFAVLFFPIVALAQKEIKFDKFLFATSEGQICVQQGSKGLTLDAGGNEVAKPVRTSNEMRFAFPNNIYIDYDSELRHYAFFNGEGKQLSPYQYRDVRFGDNLYCVWKLKKGKFGYVQSDYDFIILDDNLNVTSTASIPPALTHGAPGFSEGLCPIMITGGIGNTQYGFIDKTGKYVIKTKYSRAEKYSEGLAAVEGLDSNGRKRWGFIDKKGNLVISCQFKNMPKPFLNGLSIISEDAEMGSKLLGVINKSGKLILDNKYYDIQPFANSLILVNESGGGLQPNTKSYLMDIRGKVIKEYKTEYNTRFDTSQDYALLKSGPFKTTLIDTTGNEIKTVHTISKILNQDLFYFFDYDTKTHGFVSKNGEIKIKSPM